MKCYWNPRIAGLEAALTVLWPKPTAVNETDTVTVGCSIQPVCVDQEHVTQLWPTLHGCPALIKALL